MAYFLAAGNQTRGMECCRCLSKLVIDVVPCMCKEGYKSQPIANPCQDLLIMVLYTMPYMYNTYTEFIEVAFACITEQRP